MLFPCVRFPIREPKIVSVIRHYIPFAFHSIWSLKMLIITSVKIGDSWENLKLAPEFDVYSVTLTVFYFCYWLAMTTAFQPLTFIQFSLSERFIFSLVHACGRFPDVLKIYFSQSRVLGRLHMGFHFYEHASLVFYSEKIGCSIFSGLIRLMWPQ